MATLTDSYAYTNSDAARPLYTGSYLCKGQSFQAAVSGTLHSMMFEMYKVGTPPGSVRAHLVELSGAYGGGDDVGTANILASSSAITATTLETSVGALVEFAFDDTVSITASSAYVALLVYEDGGVADSSNCVYVRRDNAGTHTGNPVVGVVNTNTTTDSTAGRDTIFYVYVTEEDTTALTVTHAFVSAKEDTGDGSILQPSHWNADHVITGGINDTFTVDGVTYTIVNGFVTAAE